MLLFRTEKQKTEAKEYFSLMFTVCLSCKWKFVFCPCEGEETNGSYPFANG